MFEERKNGGTRQLVYMALLIALSFVGSYIKILGSIALDSLPGYFAAFYLGPVPGALVAGAGHIITAINSGFPYSLLIHIIIMLGMALAAYLTGQVYRWANGPLACLVAILFNGPLMLGALVPVTKKLGMKPGGQAFFLALIAPLSLATLVNVLLAYLVFRLVKNRI